MNRHDQTLALLEQREDIISTLDVAGIGLQFITNALFPYQRVCSLLVSEPETISWLQSAPAGSQLWDVGANMGLYSIYAAAVCHLQVRAFEPEAGNFALLNRNIMLNDLGGAITSYCCGLSDHSGLTTLYKHLDFESSAINSVGVELDAHLRPHKAIHQQGVAVFSGDDLITHHHIPPPAYIKIDVDGIEHLIVNGMSDLLMNSCQSLLVELNTELPEHQHAIQRITEAGLQISEELTAMTTIKSGYWKGLVNLIAHRNPITLDQIREQVKTTIETDKTLAAYQQMLADNRAAYGHPERVTVNYRKHR
ncbi:FkbM family methyltransferase [Niveibacterium sp.]|uniref:FkbM family methyltransferase n=1 Tax=Niveibacterium sp. TaxID=2017444 RepID=UPI0035B181B3